MNYILLLASVLFAVLNSILLHKRSCKIKPFFFNGICSSIWIILLLAANKGTLHIDKNTASYGILYGVVQLMFLFFKLKAMSSGPVSVTTLVGNCSMILSAAVGVIAWKERVSVLQILGMMLLLVGIYICSDINKSGEYRKNWKLYTVGFFCFAGFVGIVFKMFAAAANGKYCTDMLIISALFMTVCNFAFSAKHIHKIRRKDFGIAALCGVASCIYNRLNIYLAGALPSMVFFPAFNGSVIILSVISGVLVCKEKLTLKQIAGFCAGIAAILIIGTN